MKNPIVVICLFLSLCACTGTMNGMVRGSGEKISISYEQAMDYDNLQVTMMDGETFTGKAVMAGHSTNLGTGFAVASAVPANAALFGIFENYTGSMQAVLFGDKGHTMRCQFQYADSSGFAASGGVGLCEISDGRIVDVQW